MYRMIIAVAVAFSVGISIPALAQHDYPDAEVQRGSQFFRGN